MKRRQFIKGMAGGAGLGFAAHLGVMGQSLFAAGAGGDKVLVTVFCRGGWDALNVLPPVASALGAADRNAYLALRPNIKILSPLRLMQGSTVLGFGLNPALPFFQKLHQAGQLAILPRTGSLNETRSHFVQMDYIESGDHGQLQSTGYAARVLKAGMLKDSNTMTFANSPVRALRGLSNAAVNTVGDINSMPRNNVKPGESVGEMLRYSKLNSHTQKTDRGHICEYRDGIQVGEQTLCRTSVRSDSLLNLLNSHTGEIPRNKPVLEQRLVAAAQLIKTSPELRFFTVDATGFDTHFQEGADGSGGLHNSLTAVNNALEAFKTELGGEWSRVVVVVISEFGRTTKENLSGGTDHGRGGVCFVAGGSVKGVTSDPARLKWNLSSDEKRLDNPSNALAIPQSGGTSQTDVLHVLARSLSYTLALDYDSKVKPEFSALPSSDGLKLFKPV